MSRRDIGLSTSPRWLPNKLAHGVNYNGDCHRASAWRLSSREERGGPMGPTGTPGDGFAWLLRAEWAEFRAARGRVVGMAAAALAVTLLGVLAAAGIHVETPNGDAPPVPVGPGGEGVTDRFYFVHRPLAGDGSITARVTSLTGIITYP